MGEAVADRQSGQPRTLRLEYQFDRLWAEKLAQAYECLSLANCYSLTSLLYGSNASNHISLY